MTGMVLAFFLWLLLRALDGRKKPEHVPCRLCSSLVYFNGSTFVHDDGLELHPYYPALHLDLSDPNSPEIMHPALPVGR